MADNSPPRILAANAEAIAEAASILRGGGLVAVPIYRAKGRPDFNPLIVHVGGIEQAERIAEFDARARALALQFWPGPLTLVLPVRSDAGLAAAVTAGLPTVAVRCPKHPAMRALIAQTGLPLAAPSANRSGAVSPSCAEHVAAALGDRVDLILDGGACEAGIESTIVALRQAGGWQILRPGPVTQSELAATIGGEPDSAGPTSIEAPGQLASHYSPGKPIRLDAIAAEPDEFHIGFGAVAGQANLSLSGDLAEAASRLYALLHQAGTSAFPRIAIAPVPEVGMGAAINDRLRRAAAG
jgi:L-threonylcarbamoyladenylate synthase